MDSNLDVILDTIFGISLFSRMIISFAILVFLASSPEMYALSDFLIMVFVMVSEAVT